MIPTIIYGHSMRMSLGQQDFCLKERNTFSFFLVSKHNLTYLVSARFQFLAKLVEMGWTIVAADFVQFFEPSK